MLPVFEKKLQRKTKLPVNFLIIYMVEQLIKLFLKRWKTYLSTKCILLYTYFQKGERKREK